MKVKKLLMMMGCLAMCVGCSSTSSNKTEELYKDLDALATYEKASEYFNENVHYYKNVAKQTVTETNEIGYQEKSELFNENGKHSMISISGGMGYIGIVIAKDEAYYQIIPDENEIMEENESLSNGEVGKMFYDMIQVDFMNPVSKQDGAKIIEITREDQEGEIVIHMTYSLTRSYDEGETTYYQSVDTYINKDGLIYKEMISGYGEDADMKNATSLTEVTMSDINQKETFNFDDEVNKYKTYIGKSISETSQLME